MSATPNKLPVTKDHELNYFQITPFILDVLKETNPGMHAWLSTYRVTPPEDNTTTTSNTATVARGINGH